MQNIITQRGVLCFMLFLSGASLRAQIFSKVDSIKDYLRLGRNIDIVECTPSDEEQPYGNVIRQRVQIVEVLKGELKTEQVIHVLSHTNMVPGNIYMVYSGSTLDDNGDLNAFSYEPAVVEIGLWGEVISTEKVRILNDFVKETESLPLKEQVEDILTRRLSVVKSRQQQLEIEQNELEKLLSK